MKKLICILCSGLFLGACASVSNVDSDSYELGKKTTLSQIRKVAEGVYAVAQDDKVIETLDDEGKEFIAKLKDWEKEESVEEFKKYADRPITAVDIFTMDLALEEGYTVEEVDKFLKLGLYVKNPYCENEFKSYKIIQVLSDHVLTMGCEVTSYSKCSTGHDKVFVFLKEDGKLYFDQQTLSAPSGSCPTIVGVYKYASQKREDNTVPVMMFLKRTISKKQLETIDKMRAEDHLNN